MSQHDSVEKYSTLRVAGCVNLKKHDSSLLYWTLVDGLGPPMLAVTLSAVQAPTQLEEHTQAYVDALA